MRDPMARKDKSSWDPQTRGALGTDAAVGGGGGDCYAHMMLLRWGVDAAVGS